MNRGACIQAAALCKELFILHRCSSLNDPASHGQQFEVAGSNLQIPDQLSSSLKQLYVPSSFWAFEQALHFGVLVCRTNAR